jgi:ubiquinone biosynthesis protein COQ4
MLEEQTQLTEYRRPDGVVPDRRYWRTIFGAWRGFTVTGKRMYEFFYRASLEISIPSTPRLFHQVRAHPHGAKIIRDKPDLLALLSDDTYLASLPPGSVGHAYRSFLTTNRLDATIFDEAAVVRPYAESRNWHEDYYYFLLRCNAMHDLQHVITGYGPDLAGEITGIGFQCGQMEPAGALKRLGFAVAMVLPGGSLRHKLRVYRQAVERGRRADKLAAAPWEELLDKPLDEVRARLGVAPTAQAHPGGVWFTGWTPPGMKPATRWDYDRILADEIPARDSG